MQVAVSVHIKDVDLVFLDSSFFVVDAQNTPWVIEKELVFFYMTNIYLAKCQNNMT